MTTERESAEVVRDALTQMWHDETPADYRSCGNIHDDCDDPYPLDALEALTTRLSRLGEALERIARSPWLEARAIARTALDSETKGKV